MTGAARARRTRGGGPLAAALACAAVSALGARPAAAQPAAWPPGVGASEGAESAAGGAPLAVSAGVRGWPTPAGAAHAGALQIGVRRPGRWYRVDAAGALAVAPRVAGGAAAGAPRALDGRLVLGTAPLRLGALGVDAALGLTRDAYDPRAAWAQRGAQARAWVGGPAGGVWAGAAASAPVGARATPGATEWRLGGWARRGGATLSAAVRGVATHPLARRPELPGDTSAAAGCVLDYDATRAIQQYRTVCPTRLATGDALAGVAWAWRGTTLRAHAGYRFAARLATGRGGRGDAWGGVGATLPPVGPVALTVDYTRAPHDVVRGTPAAPRLFAGVRWTPGGRRRPAAGRRARRGHGARRRRGAQRRSA